MLATPGKPPERKKGSPTPWLMLRQRFAEEWKMAPFDIPGPSDWEHELFDERGRQIEIWVLEAEYPLY